MPETGEKDIRPSWVPLKKDPNFACSVMGRKRCQRGEV